MATNWIPAMNRIDREWMPQGSPIADVEVHASDPGAARALGKGFRRLAKDKDKPERIPKLPLKKIGEQRDVSWVRAGEEELRRLSEDNPDVLQALHRLVEGRTDEVTKEDFKKLKAFGLLTPQQLPRPYLIPVMKAAYRETPDGPVIVDPFDLKIPEDLERLENADDELARMQIGWRDRLLRDIRKFGKGKGDAKDDKGQSR